MVLMCSLSSEFLSALISCTFLSPPLVTNNRRAFASCGSTLANWLTTCFKMCGGASFNKGSSAGRWTHFWRMFFRAFLDWKMNPDKRWIPGVGNRLLGNNKHLTTGLLGDMSFVSSKPLKVEGKNSVSLGPVIKCFVFLPNSNIEQLWICKKIVAWHRLAQQICRVSGKDRCTTWLRASQKFKLLFPRESSWENHGMWHVLLQSEFHAFESGGRRNVFLWKSLSPSPEKVGESGLRFKKRISKW